MNDAILSDGNIVTNHLMKGLEPMNENNKVREPIEP